MMSGIRSVALLSLALVAFLLSACGSSHSLTHNDLLTGGSSKSWKMVDYIVPNSATAFPECLRDNRFNFSSSGNFVNDDGDIPCSQSGETRLHGTWRFSGDSTRLLISGSGMQLNARIVELTSSRLVLEELADNNTVVSTSRFEAD